MNSTPSRISDSEFADRNSRYVHITETGSVRSMKSCSRNCCKGVREYDGGLKNAGLKFGFIVMDWIVSRFNSFPVLISTSTNEKREKNAIHRPVVTNPIF